MWRNVFSSFARHLVIDQTSDECFLSCIDFLEALSRPWIGIAIRVPAHGQPPVGALDLGGAGVGLDTEDLMEIDCGHPHILIAAGGGRATK